MADYQKDQGALLAEADADMQRAAKLTGIPADVARTIPKEASAAAQSTKIDPYAFARKSPTEAQKNNTLSEDRIIQAEIEQQKMEQLQHLAMAAILLIVLSIIFFLRKSIASYLSTTVKTKIQRIAMIVFFVTLVLILFDQDSYDPDDLFAYDWGWQEVSIIALTLSFLLSFLYQPITLKLIQWVNRGD